MTTTTTDVHGPIDFVLIEFPADRLTGEAGPALLDLVERGVIRLLDLLVISKAEDGSVEAVEVTDPTGPGAGFEYFAGARSGLLDDDDIREAAAAMTPGTVAALDHLREQLGGAVRRRGQEQRWRAHRQRPHPCSGGHGCPGRTRVGELRRKRHARTASRGCPYGGGRRNRQRRQRPRPAPPGREVRRTVTLRSRRPAGRGVPAAGASKPPPPPQPAHRMSSAQLKSLAELRDQGILTEEEFAAQKSKILGA